MSANYAYELVSVYHFRSVHLSRSAKAVGAQKSKLTLAPRSQSDPPSIGG